MKELFPIRRKDDEDSVGKCKKFLNRYCHPAQVGTGIIFSTIGIGLAAAGVLYADGINFVVHSLPVYVADGNYTTGPIDYVRDSYKGSISEAMAAGWKQVPFSYCIGHYIGGKLKDKVTEPFRRR